MNAIVWSASGGFIGGLFTGVILCLREVRKQARTKP